MRSRRGNTSIIPLLMLSAAIAAFYNISQSSFDNREKEIRSAERVLGFKQLEARLKGAFDDPLFISESVYKPNVNTGKIKGKEAPSPRLKFVHDSYLLEPKKFKIFSPHSKVWIGEGARLSYPNFELCDPTRECPMEPRIVDMDYQFGAEGEYLKIVIGLHSHQPDITGPFNSKSEKNQITLSVKAGLVGLVVQGSSLYCDQGYVLHYMHGDPLEVLCRPLN